MLKKSIIVCFSCLFSFAFFVPEKVQRKADAVLAKFYEDREIVLKPISISEAMNQKTKADFTTGNFFEITSEEKKIGYGYIGNAPSKTASFDYLVIFDRNFIIQKSKVLIYREEYGGEIGSKRWLKQFIGGGLDKTFQYNDNIIPISGATISVRSMTNAINDLLQSITYLKQNAIL